MRHLFISDLHLIEARPDVAAAFEAFLCRETNNADSLYILGDLFEQPLIMWVLIGWGWLSVLVMVFSVIDTVGQL